MKRLGKYTIPGLEREFDNIYSLLATLGGKVVDKLPPIKGVEIGSVYSIKQSDGSYKHYKKLSLNDKSFTEI